MRVTRPISDAGICLLFGLMEVEKISLRYDSVDCSWYGSWGGVVGASDAEGPRCPTALEALEAALAAKAEGGAHGQGQE